MSQTIAELQVAEAVARAEYERRTVAFVIGRTRRVTVAEARAVFDKYHKVDDWKEAVSAHGVPLADLVAFTNAVTFYHGGKPPQVVEEAGGTYFVWNNGYAC